MWVLISDILVQLVILYSWKIIKLSSCIRVFGVRYVMNGISKVPFHGSFLLLIYLYLHSLYFSDRNPLFIFGISIVLQLFYLILVQHLLPLHAIFQP